MPLDQGDPHKREGERRAPPLKRRYFIPVLGRLTWKWLQIGADMLLITSTGDKLLRNFNIDDLEWPWTPKIKGFSGFFAILGCDTHFKWIAPKLLETTQFEIEDNLSMKLSALNVDLAVQVRIDALDSRRPAHAGVKEGYPSKKWLNFIRCWLVYRENGCR